MKSGVVSSCADEIGCVRGRLGCATRPRNRPRKSLCVFLEFGEDELGDFLERIEHALARDGNGFERRLALHGELLAELVHREDVGKVALVELQDVGNRIEIEVVILEMLAQVIEPMPRSLALISTSC